MSDEKNVMQCSITGGLFDKGVFAEFHMPDDFKVSNRKMIVMEVEDYDALRRELEAAKAREGER